MHSVAEGVHLKVRPSGTPFVGLGITYFSNLTSARWVLKAVMIISIPSRVLATRAVIRLVVVRRDISQRRLTATATTTGATNTDRERNSGTNARNMASMRGATKKAMANRLKRFIHGLTQWGS
jgi:hypothetical protein